MKKLQFEDLPSTNTPVCAENLNKMQQNVEDEFNNQIIYANTALLAYESDTRLVATLNINGIYEKRDNIIVMLTTKHFSNTPFASVTNLMAYTPESNDTLRIKAIGSGFVNGHSLYVDVLIIKKK